LWIIKKKYIYIFTAAEKSTFKRKLSYASSSKSNSLLFLSNISDDSVIQKPRSTAHSVGDECTGMNN